MKYKISNAYIDVNGECIKVGVVLGPENDPQSPYTTEIIPISEYEKGMKEFRYGREQINDLVSHYVGVFENFRSKKHVDEKWIRELELLGYDTSKLIND